MTLIEYLTGIADAIRGKTGETGEIPASEFPERISGIQTGVDTSGDTVTADVLLSGYTAHNAAGQQINGSLNPLKHLRVSSSSGSISISDASYYSGSSTQGTVHVSGTTNSGEYVDIIVDLEYS